MKTLLALAALALAGAAHAVDGVILIDQAKALAGHITPGDAPGFPVTISQPGSYRLSGNLAVAGLMPAVIVDAPGVSLDLNGFTVSGPRCGPQRCTVGTAGGSPGITIRAPRTVLANGRVDGFHATGIYVEPNIGEITLERVHSTRHGELGAILRQSAQVDRSRFEDNVSGGLVVESGRISASTFGGGGVWLVQAASSRVLLERNVFDGSSLWSGARSAGTNLCNGQLC